MNVKIMQGKERPEMIVESKLDKMLKRHMLTKSKFEEIISNQDMPRDEYIQMALKFDCPRGIPYEETQTQLIEYESTLNTIGREFVDDSELYDAMWFTAKQMHDVQAEHFIYSIDYEPWTSFDEEPKQEFKTILERQKDWFRQQIAKYKRLKQDRKRQEYEKQFLFHKSEMDRYGKLIHSCPPKNAPHIIEVEDADGSLIFEVVALRDEFDKGMHEWCNNNWTDLLRWACHQYRINGKFHTAKQWADSYNNRNRKK